MKNAFSMIELIFVIVIIGILVAIAIPRLSASRDDAIVAKARAELRTALSDVITYNLARGHYSHPKNMTNVDFKQNAFVVKGEKCLEFNLIGTKALQVKISKKGLCDRVLENSAVSPYLQSDAGDLKHNENTSYIPLDSGTINELRANGL
ncbi:MAG: type II secretion system GspH family protein [Campylobacter sp.]|nr:type II secretion system GspH family protein [Campylobacter sp.]